MMDNNFKIPNTLSQYLRLKAKERKISESNLSKLIIPGSSGSLIASITHDSKISEKKIKKIAEFFNEDPNLLTFMVGRIPKSIHDMIIKNKDLQFFLLNLFQDSKSKDKK